MEFNENKADILKLLIQQEEIISALYKGFADKFTEFAVFWVGLATEEKSHASQLRMLSPIIMADDIKLDLSKMDASKIVEDIAAINDVIKKIIEKDFSHKDAIQSALSIEKTFIEREFFKSCEGENNQLRVILRGLAYLTENHVNRLKEFYEQHK